MKKIKVIKREEGGVKLPPTNKTSNQRPKKQKSVESTIKDWITERRENDDAEDRSRRSQLDSWDIDPTPAEAV